jgi:GAF domain-containing protein
VTALYLGAVFAERDADLAARARAEDELARRERLLQAVSTSAARLLAGQTTAETLLPVLTLLGEAAEVNRAYAMSFHPADGDVLAKLVNQWESYPPYGEAHDPNVPFPIRAAGFGRWLDLLERGEAVHGPVHSMPEGERSFLEGQRIRSLVVAPIDAGELWGVVGFEDCATDRAWSPAEVDAGRSAGRSGGSGSRLNRGPCKSGSGRCSGTPTT